VHTLSPGDVWSPVSLAGLHRNPGCQSPWPPLPVDALRRAWHSGTCLAWLTAAPGAVKDMQQPHDGHLNMLTKDGIPASSLMTHPGVGSFRSVSGPALVSSSQVAITGVREQCPAGRRDGSAMFIDWTAGESKVYTLRTAGHHAQIRDRVQDCYFTGVVRPLVTA
jgi:hypothetical protein